MKRTQKAMMVGAILAGLTAAIAAPLAGDFDFSSLPSNPAKAQADIAQLKVTAAQAIETVLKETKGVVKSVTVMQDTK
ncbi:MAG TPA: hypothetical protein VG711_07925, partial [Phycisphaerales bacterium]|nr:hypothetical protein [Phycisphaerales bacterium]